MLRFLMLSLTALAFLGVAPQVRATEVSFLSGNVHLVGQGGSYLVVKTNVNVRKEPKNKAVRVTKLNRRDVVEVIGRVKDTSWYAVRKNGEDLGYVFTTSLTPLIDGKIDTPLKGRIDLSEFNKPDCTYEITYAGRTSEEDIVFVSSDYLARFACQTPEKNFTFTANLFMAEIPFDLGGEPVFQIAFDLPEIAAGYENFLSVTVNYDLVEDTVSLDQVSLNKYKEKKPLTKLPAPSTRDALHAATRIQLSALNADAWKTIATPVQDTP